MQKKRIFAIGILLACLLLLSAAAIPLLRASGIFERLVRVGEQHKTQMRDEESAAASVNGVAITKQTLDRAYDLQLAFYEVNKALYGSAGEPPDKDAVLKSMVEREALVQEAARLGLSATEEQISEHFAQVDEALRTGEAEEAKRVMDAYLEGLDMDYETYREVYEKPLARRELSVENLYMHAMEKQTDQAAWETYKEDVVQKAVIEYFPPYAE